MAEETDRELARWDPFRELSTLDPFGEGTAGRLSRMMKDLLGEPGRAGWAAPLDVTEADDQYVISVEVPGVERKDLTVECSEGMLRVHGEKKSEREETGKKARLLERSYGAFSRALRLPPDADPDQISASFKDGVLKIEVKRTPEAKPKTIAIKD